MDITNRYTMKSQTLSKKENHWYLPYCCLDLDKGLTGTVENRTYNFLQSLQLQLPPAWVRLVGHGGPGEVDDVQGHEAGLE